MAGRGGALGGAFGGNAGEMKAGERAVKAADLRRRLQQGGAAFGGTAPAAKPMAANVPPPGFFAPQFGLGPTGATMGGLQPRVSSPYGMNNPSGPGGANWNGQPFGMNPTRPAPMTLQSILNTLRPTPAPSPYGINNPYVPPFGMNNPNGPVNHRNREGQSPFSTLSLPRALNPVQPMQAGGGGGYLGGVHPAGALGGSYGGNAVEMTQGQQSMGTGGGGFGSGFRRGGGGGPYSPNPTDAFTKYLQDLISWNMG